eukprot:TRINITY_DN12883_c0_g1_i2.p1 TRINITY_DN12883_c0_g1~~TRINITY_DN12883_c0_g1_i2.p1  ORF type:complete len:489 (+),score=45.80 TRINITY_DN12883_c0_g1_i2:270-1736(+)
MISDHACSDCCDESAGMISSSGFRCVDRFCGPWTVFLLLISASVFVNFDTGGTAAILVLLSKGCKIAARSDADAFEYAYDPAYPCLSRADEGVLCGVSYVGLVLGCPIANAFLGRFSPKKVLLVGLWLNAAATFVFSVMLEKWYLWGSKFVVGLSQSIISVYAPVWVAKFAPASVKTLWFGLMQSACAIGNLVGYAVVGYLVNLGLFYQYAFMIQACGLLAITLIILFVGQNRINVSDDKDASNTAHANAPDSEPCAKVLMGFARRVRREVSVLARLPLFISCVFSISALCFVVTGIQLWASAYFCRGFRRPLGQVNTVFVLVAGSAPIMGVIMGSSFVDALGGYDTPSTVLKSCRLLLSWGFVCGMAGIGVVLLPPPDPWDPSEGGRFWLVVVCIWVLLFFGGGILPAITGISMTAVPEESRCAASSWSMMASNVLGYAFGAYIPGQVAESMSLTTAMQVICLGPLAGVWGLFTSYVIAVRAARGQS